MIRKFFLICAIPVCFVRAQNSPIKITIYSNDSATVSQVVEKPSTTFGGCKNLIKWNYCLLGRGVFLLNYERHLSDHFTFEGGAGITFSDFVFAAAYEIGNSSRKNYSTSTNPTTGATTTTSILSNPFETSIKRLGFAVELSPRYYFEKDEFQGVYVSPYISYRKYNYGLSVEESNGLSYNSNTRIISDLYYSFLDVGAKLGYQCSFSYNEAFYYDFYVGFAYRSAHINTLQRTEVYGGSFGDSVTYSEYLQTMGLPQVMLGAKIGYAF